MAKGERFHGALFLAALLAACGGAAGDAAPPPRAPELREKTKPDATGAMSEPEPRTVEEAQERIAKLRADLDEASPKKEESPAKPEAPKAPPGDEAKPGEPARDACARPCSALASMRRAVEALCRMTGDADKRCADARRTLGESVTRAAACGCEGR